MIFQKNSKNILKFEGNKNLMQGNLYCNLNWNNMLTTMEKPLAPFWKVSKVLKRKTSNFPILKDNSQVSYKQQEKANTMLLIM